MKSLFIYNWQVRDEWFLVLSELSNEELIKERQGGLGSIQKTLLHIIDVEYSWIRAILGRPDVAHNFDDYKVLETIKSLSDQYREEILEFLNSWTELMEYDEINPIWDSVAHQKGEIIRHLIVHEIHHIGQMSVWAKELGLKQVNTNFIGRNL